MSAGARSGIQSHTLACGSIQRWGLSEKEDSLEEGEVLLGFGNKWWFMEEVLFDLLWGWGGRAMWAWQFQVEVEPSKALEAIVRSLG